MTTQTQQEILTYLTTVGFTADFGGRGFHLPTDIAVRSDGRIYVMSRSSNSATLGLRIGITDLEHNFHGEFGGHGTGEGQFIRPTAIAFDSRNHLFAADDYLDRITEFDADNNFVRQWGEPGVKPGQINGPSGLVFDRDDNLLVVDHMNHRVQKFTSDGRYITQFGSNGNRRGQLNYPWGIAIGPDSRIYIADWRNDRVQRFAPDGEYVDTYGESGSEEGQFNRPSDVAVGPDGFIYVADWMNQRVQVFDSDWYFQQSLRGEATLSPWATEYLNANDDERRAREVFKPVIPVESEDPHEVSARIESYFWDPVAVEVDSEGRLYVLETNRHRFQVYERGS